MKINHINPLSGCISILLTPDTGGGAGAGAQPPQPPAFADPFANLDMDLLDDAAKTAITEARSSMTKLAGQAQLAGRFQSEADQVKHLLAVQATELQRLQNLNKPAEAPVQLTLEQEFEQEYVQAGMPAEVAKVQAKVQAKMMEKRIGTERAQWEKDMGPIANQTAMHSAQAAFQSLQGKPYAQVPEVVKQMEEAAASMIQDGRQVSMEVLDNLGSMYHYQHMQMHPPQQHQTTPQFSMPPAPPRGIFSFNSIPTGGVVNTTPTRVVDPAVTAAMAPVKARFATLFPGLVKK